MHSSRSVAFGRLITKERLASHLKHPSALFCCKTVKYDSVLLQNVKILYFLSRNVKIRYFLSRNVKIRAMSRKNAINCVPSRLRILISPEDNKEEEEEEDNKEEEEEA